MAESAISIQNLNKYYGKLQALNGLSLEINEGEFFGFLGPNGAGKTTTINILSGLSTYHDGQVSVFGNDAIKQYREVRKLIGLVPQEFNFDGFFSVEEIMKYYAGFFGIAGHEAKKRIDELLEQFSLSSKRKNTMRELSGGMKRRLLIARGIVHKPKILILDEPTAGVDVELRRELWQFMRDINKQGTTILLTSHYIEEVERLAKRIGIINKGTMIEVDEKEKLIEKLHKHNLDLTLTKTLRSIPKSLQKFHPTFLDENKIRFVCGKDLSKKTILSAVKKAGLQVKSEEVTKSNLEDIFLDVTGVQNGKS